jgi:L-rhamnose-H+ transport protein
LGPLLSNELITKFKQDGAVYIILGLLLGVIGIAFTGWAGRQKEIDLENAEGKKSQSFSLKKGLPICVLAGVLSAFYGLSLDAGKPIAAVATKYGAGNYCTNVIYIFSNIGAFVTTLLYCLYLHKKDNSISEHFKGNKKKLGLNYFFAILTGLMWYGQFFFYGLGTVRMANYEFTSWAIHMILLVLISMIVGVLLNEWRKSSKKAMIVLSTALIILVLAVVFLSYGNYLAMPK